MRQTLRNLGALPLALVAIIILVGLMKALISPRSEETVQAPLLSSVVYLVEAMDEEAEPAPQRVVEEPEQPQPEPEPPEPPEALEPEPLPETLELPLDVQPLDMPAVAKLHKPKPKPKPKAKPKRKKKVSKKSVSKPKTANKSSGKKTTSKKTTSKKTAKKKTKKPAARAKFDRRAIRAPRPKYPANAKRRRIEGYVTVRFTVTRQGKVRNPKVIAAKPSGVFERSALNAIRRWRFRKQSADYPGVTQKIRFNLRD